MRCAPRATRKHGKSPGNIEGVEDPGVEDHCVEDHCVEDRCVEDHHDAGVGEQFGLAGVVDRTHLNCDAGRHNHLG